VSFGHRPRHFGNEFVPAGLVGKDHPADIAAGVSEQGFVAASNPVDAVVLDEVLIESKRGPKRLAQGFATADS
jgi:hypothetical protein